MTWSAASPPIVICFSDRLPASEPRYESKERQNVGVPLTWLALAEMAASATALMVGVVAAMSVARQAAAVSRTCSPANEVGA